jgi:hypothetical protein
MISVDRYNAHTGETGIEPAELLNWPYRRAGTEDWVAGLMLMT